MTDAKPPDERLALVFAESVRAIERQASAVDELRGRATAMVGAGAVVAGFLGQPALERGGCAAAVGAAAFAALGLMAAFVLWPREWDFITNVRQVIKHHIDRDDDASIDQLRWALAIDLRDAYEKNEPKRKDLVRAVTASCGLLVVEVGAFLLAL